MSDEVRPEFKAYYEGMADEREQWEAKIKEVEKLLHSKVCSSFHSENIKGYVEAVNDCLTILRGE